MLVLVVQQGRALFSPPRTLGLLDRPWALLRRASGGLGLQRPAPRTALLALPGLTEPPNLFRFRCRRAVQTSRVDRSLSVHAALCAFSAGTFWGSLCQPATTGEKQAGHGAASPITAKYPERSRPNVSFQGEEIAESVNMCEA